jgi:hypothetical protein
MRSCSVYTFLAFVKSLLTFHPKTALLWRFNHLKPRDYFTYHQVNTPKFYLVLTLRLFVLYGSQNRQRLLPYTTLAVWFCITDVESVYCAVRAESLYETDSFSL